MNKLQLTGIALAAGAASMFAVAPAFAADAAGAPMVKCMGANACKGHGACKTATSSCKGQNACKGKGMMMVKSEKECMDRKGTVAK
jgi:hypothetical protein